MKKRSLLKTMLLLCALIVGYGSAWADTWEETSLANLTSSDIFVIVGTVGDNSYSMSNNNGTGSAPTAAAVTIVNGKITSTVTDAIQWKLSGNATDGYTFYPNGSTATWLYCNTQAASSSNNNMRVGTGARKVFVLDDNNYLITKTMKDNNNNNLVNRYVCVYNGADWRGYVNASPATTIKFYKKVAGAVADPTFSPAGGIYTTAQSVTISCTTSGASIYYTTDGTTPTSSSTLYNGAISVSETKTIKAIAIKGDDASNVASSTYTIVSIEHAGSAEDPYTVADARNAIDINTGVSEKYATGIVSAIVTEYSDTHKNITFDISTDGSTTSDQLRAYRCTKGDGKNDPDVKDIQVGDVVVIKGNLTKYNDIYEFAQGNYLVEHKPKPATPTFDPVAGTYTSVQTVSISTTTEDAEIRYTTDGNEPTTSSTKFVLPIYVGSDITIKAIAIKDGVISDVATAAYTINLNPVVTVTSTAIEAPKTGANGTITATYENITDVLTDVVFYESDGTTDATYDHSWVTTDFDNSNNLEYVIDENTANVARTAYLKIYAIGNEGEAYSELITITQEANVPTVTYTLATSVVPGKHYVIASGTDGDIKAMGAQNSNNRAAVDVYANDGTITFAENAGVCEFIIYGPNADGRYFIYDETKDKEGYLYAASTSSNYLKTQKTINDNCKWTISFDDEEDFASIVADGSSNRNVMQFNSSSSLFSCYTSASQGDLYLYEKSGEIAPTTISVTFAASGYASYCSPYPLDLTPAADYAAYVVTQVNKEAPTVMFEKITGAVPAETPFILYGKEVAGTTVNLPVATGETTAPENNMLIGTLEPTPITTVVGSFTNFGLSGGQFVKMNNGTIPANKAYLPVPTSFVTSSAPALTIVFGDDETTGIGATLNDSVNDNVIYDLSGRHVAQPTKGIYIMNGKKVVIK